MLSDLGGTGLGQFSQLAVTNIASLDGLLFVLLANGFNPVPGDQFDIVTASAISGQFANVILPTMPNGDPLFELIMGSQKVTLRVVPEPSTLAVLSFLSLVVIRPRR